MSAMASQITSLTIFYSTVYSGADQRKHQSSASLAFVRRIHRHERSVTRKVFPFDHVITTTDIYLFWQHVFNIKYVCKRIWELPFASEYNCDNVHDDVIKWKPFPRYSALCVEFPVEFPATGESPAQRPVTQSFDVFFDLRLNLQLSKQSWSWRFETLSRPLWRHLNEYSNTVCVDMVLIVKKKWHELLMGLHCIDHGIDQHIS